MSKNIPPSKPSKRSVLGGRAGRAPGRGFSDHASTSSSKGGKGPTKGAGSRKLGGRPPKGPGR